MGDVHEHHQPDGCIPHAAVLGKVVRLAGQTRRPIGQDASEAFDVDRGGTGHRFPDPHLHRHLDKPPAGA